MRRCLVSWDHEATGIWLVSSEHSRCQPALRDALPPALREDLKRWNDQGAQLFDGRVVVPDQEQVARWRATARELAEQAQDALGAEWEVLYEDAGAWTWVRKRWV